MSRWEHQATVVGLCFALCTACGGDDPVPPLSPAPPELPAPTETPPVVEPPTPETPSETPEAETPEATPAPDLAPIVPVISGEASIAPPMPDFDELLHEDATFEMSRGTTHYRQVEYPPAVQGAILRQLRATIRDLLDGFVPRPETDEDMGSFYDAACDANLALPEMVAYTCVRTITEGRGEMEIVSATKLYAVTADNVRELEADDFLIPGTDLDELAARYDIDPSGPMTLTATGIGFVAQDGEMATVPYVDLGALIDPRSAAARVPGVAAIAAVTTQLALDAGPPASIAVLTPARPLPAAAIFAASQRASWIFADVRGTAIAAATPMVIAASTPIPDGATSVDRPWDTPLRVRRAHLHRSASLRPGRRGAGEGPPLPAGTVLYAVLGDTAAGPSRTGGGQWTFVAVSETRSGWLPSALVRDTDTEAALAAPSIAAFVAALPEADRAPVRASCAAIESGLGYVTFAERASSTLVGVVPTPEYRAAPTARFVLDHPGRLLDGRLAGVRGAMDREALVLLTWPIEGDELHGRLEIYALPASGTAPGAPILTLTLASTSAPERERQSIAIGVTRHGHYAPLTVRGPGRAEARYVWNGTTLVPETE